MFGITFETAILALRCNFSGIACDSLGYPPSSLLQLFRLFSDIKGVQYRARIYCSHVSCLEDEAEDGGDEVGDANDQGTVLGVHHTPGILHTCPIINIFLFRPRRRVFSPF